jgi:hypothetical protein
MRSGNPRIFEVLMQVPVLFVQPLFMPYRHLFMGGAQVSLSRALGTHSTQRHLLDELFALAFRAFRRWSLGKNQVLELISALRTLVFEDWHGWNL